MRNVYKVLSFFFYFVSPFIIGYLQYTVFISGGLDLEVKGMFILLFAFFFFVKYVEHKKSIAEIQDRHRLAIIIYSGIKRILMVIGMYWILITIDSNIDDLVLTMKLFTITFVIGLFFAILGNKKKKDLPN